MRNRSTPSLALAVTMLVALLPACSKPVEVAGRELALPGAALGRELVYGFASSAAGSSTHRLAFSLVYSDDGPPPEMKLEVKVTGPDGFKLRTRLTFPTCHPERQGSKVVRICPGKLVAKGHYRTIKRPITLSFLPRKGTYRVRLRPTGVFYGVSKVGLHVYRSGSKGAATISGVTGTAPPVPRTVGR